MDNAVWCFCSDWGCFFDWLDRWQTLISGILATGAAALTILFLRRQIRSTEQQHEERIRLEETAAYRRSLMARAGMPLALSELCAYTERAFGFIYGFGPSLPEPQDALQSLKSSIEYVDDPAAIEIAELISRYQISRVRVLELDRRNQNAVLDRYYDHIELRHIIDGLFPYARRETAQFEGNPASAERYLLALDECATLGMTITPENRNALSERIAAVFNPEMYAAGSGPRPLEDPGAAPAS